VDERLVASQEELSSLLYCMYQNIQNFVKISLDILEIIHVK
jgi:hypothetical protein